MVDITPISAARDAKRKGTKRQKVFRSLGQIRGHFAGMVMRAIFGARGKKNLKDPRFWFQK